MTDSNLDKLSILWFTKKFMGAIDPKGVASWYPQGYDC